MKIYDCSDGTCQNADEIQDMQEKINALEKQIAELKADRDRLLNSYNALTIAYKNVQTSKSANFNPPD